MNKKIEMRKTAIEAIGECLELIERKKTYVEADEAYAASKKDEILSENPDADIPEWIEEQATRAAWAQEALVELERALEKMA